jgi:type I site-specific restriction-modification system R (restriction) subunit
LPYSQPQLNRNSTATQPQSPAADLIITASHRPSLLARLLNLDQAPKIMHRAPCPVLVYHEEHQTRITFPSLGPEMRTAGSGLPPRRGYLQERKSPYQAIVAFSGEHEFNQNKVTEASLNRFSSSVIAERIQEDPYRFLICADKFQTGYDEPLLHTMYVDKPLAGIKAVQTFSRLNRAHAQKHDVFVLDFLNDVDTITQAFSDYYRTTVLSEETDPNKLHDLKAALDGYQVYAPDEINAFVALYLENAARDKLDPILDRCVAVYKEQEDLSKGILESIDLDSYRAEKKAAMRILVPDEDAEIEPVPTSGGGRKAEVELDRLSNILKTFNDQFKTLFTDADRVGKRIKEDIAPKVAGDQAYQNGLYEPHGTADCGGLRELTSAIHLWGDPQAPCEAEPMTHHPAVPDPPRRVRDRIRGFAL